MPETQLPPDLSRQFVFILALAGVCASQRPPQGASWTGADVWLANLLELLGLDRQALPADVPPEDVAKVAADRENWTPKEEAALARAVVQAALAPEKRGKQVDKDKPKVVYTPVARALSHSTLSLLGLDAGLLLPRAEAELAATLVAAVTDKEAVEEARSKQKDGWGGSLGRTLATAGGVIAGGVLLGVTGGLAAPAIAAMLAPLGIGAALSATAAPFVIGSLFGLTGGGLAGHRVSQRWKGVDEFSFVEVGANSKPLKEEVEDLKARQSAHKEMLHDEMGVNMDEKGELLFDADVDENDDDAAARREVLRNRHELEGRLMKLSLDAGTTEKGTKTTPPETPLEGQDVVAEVKDKRPSLTATIVVPGLLTVSQTEAISAWRAICSGHKLLPYQSRPGNSTPQDRKLSDNPDTSGLKDGRDVYVLRYETKTMLQTGRELETWVFSKVKNMAGTEIVKRTVLGAYYAAIALPLSVYTLSTMALDNSWMSAQNKAVKAGRLLGEVLAQRVQGERPVVLIGTSVGALTVLHALLHLASLPEVPKVVESVFLVSLPSAPTADEWASVRRVTARRVVNAWSGGDLVLATVVRLHEVVSRGVTGSNGVKVAGLGPVSQPGVEDIDLSEVLAGHNEINTRAGEVLEVLEID